jgi:hypothetical protein
VGEFVGRLSSDGVRGEGLEPTEPLRAFNRTNAAKLQAVQALQPLQVHRGAGFVGGHDPRPAHAFAETPGGDSREPVGTNADRKHFNRWITLGPLRESRVASKRLAECGNESLHAPKPGLRPSAAWYGRAASKGREAFTEQALPPGPSKRSGVTPDRKRP